MNSIEHYVDGKFTSHAEFLPPEKYGFLRDNIVRACVDVLIVDDQGLILLGKRNIEPLPNWWTFGGRMIPGETPNESAARTVKEDLGLIFPPERFIFLSPLSLVFGTRNEVPKENGSHDVTLVHLLSVNRNEVSLIKPRKGEYDEVKWFNNEELSSLNSHPAILEMAKRAQKSS
jgi:ADP-ribose pyrophosphatase YjhB (NUDIX family)